MPKAISIIRPRLRLRVGPFAVNLGMSGLTSISLLTRALGSGGGSRGKALGEPKAVQQKRTRSEAFLLREIATRGWDDRTVAYDRREGWKMIASDGRLASIGKTAWEAAEAIANAEEDPLR